MQQAKFSLTPSLVEFLNHYKQYGFKDKSSMVQAALIELKKEIEQENLKQSADLYAELYAEDEELQELTHTAVTGWPE
ncbi:MAG TPA: hypothetical protein PLD25_18065 [Chloroflexota bacterium]|jgi:hypothetical protein|nr:hypothetical protein [Chloroflexota bacterium]